jgi:hypothetical protein
MFRAVDHAKPGFAALSDSELTPVWFSSTVLLTALGFYMWPHTFGSALSARNENVLRRNAVYLPIYQLLLAFKLRRLRRGPEDPEARQQRPGAAHRVQGRVPAVVRRADRLGRRAVRAGPGLDADGRLGYHRGQERRARAEPGHDRRGDDAADEAARAGGGARRNRLQARAARRSSRCC